MAIALLNNKSPSNTLRDQPSLSLDQILTILVKINKNFELKMRRTMAGMKNNSNNLIR